MALRFHRLQRPAPAHRPAEVVRLAGGEAAHRVADERGLLDAERVHEVDVHLDVVGLLERHGVRVAPALAVHGVHVEVLGERADVVGEVDPARGARAAAVHEDQRVALAGLLVVDLPRLRLDGPAGRRLGELGHAVPAFWWCRSGGFTMSLYGAIVLVMTGECQPRFAASSISGVFVTGSRRACERLHERRCRRAGCKRFHLGCNGRRRRPGPPRGPGRRSSSVQVRPCATSTAPPWRAPRR